MMVAPGELVDGPSGPPRPSAQPPTETIMKTITLGDIAAPNVVLGLMRIADLPDDDIRTLIRTARDSGIDFFDHAAVYGNEMHGCEQRFAGALRLSPSERAEITIQTLSL